jgi:hypothetical protein
MKTNVVAKRISEILPDVVKNSVEWIKLNFDETGKTLLDSASGTTGILLKFFAQPAIDKYFEHVSKNKLADFGTNTYFKAAYNQSNKSITMIESQLQVKISYEEVIDAYVALSSKNQEVVLTDTLVIFNPIYHPAVQFVKNNQIELFKKLGLENSLIDAYISDYNSDITKQVSEEFGDDYSKHLKEVDGFIISTNEAKLLTDIISADRIGFLESENLNYEQTFAQWKELSLLNRNDESKKEDKKNIEKEQKPIETLIEEYFGSGECIKKLLYVVADFGKGKTVFMKHYAALKAKEYIRNNEGYFPICFNLRNYSSYKTSDKLGVINNYLKIEYGFDIESEALRNRKYLFLMDSLDESGDLNKEAIDAVISSIKQIELLDPIHCRNNRIVITSRPIYDVLDKKIREHNPICRKVENENIPHYLSIYGFKKIQFNNWLIKSLQASNRLPKEDDVPLITNILEKIKKTGKIDVYKQLVQEETLSKNELQRPIFAYMIYQLIVKNIDFLSVGKIGVFLSFLNLLTKEAKHINDPTFSVRLTEEIEYRNLLHATAALWMLQRHKGKQGSLKKADICRVLDGEHDGDDNSVLRKHKDISNIQFLSHSYFGENNNTLHFQHQSFAEILLAEYYIKVFIKYALDKNVSVNEARSKLLLGIPSDQTIIFVKELLRLIRETAVNEETEIQIDTSILEKRKLLFPLMASVSTDKHNRLFCNALYFDWYKNAIPQDDERNYPEILLKNWCLGKSEIVKIEELAAKILNSDESFLLAQGTLCKNLYENELLLLNNDRFSTISHDVDKWLALIVGSTLCNEFTEAEPILFNTKYQIAPENLFSLIRNLVYSDDNFETEDLFLGVDMRNFEGYIKVNYELSEINMSFSYFNNVQFFFNSIYNTSFNYCIFVNCGLIYCRIDQSSFDYSIFNHGDFVGCDIDETSFYEFIITESEVSVSSCCNKFLYHGLFNSIDNYLDVYGQIYIGEKIENNRVGPGLEEFLTIFRILCNYNKLSDSYYDNELRKAFKFKSDTVRKLFFRALKDNKTINKLLEEDKKQKTAQRLK